jgi:carbamoyl-phosphate synthase large subunit
LKRLLLTGGGGAGSEAIYRLWRDRYDLHFADADVNAIDPEIPTDRRVSIPFASAPNFAEKIGTFCRNAKIDLLIPGVDEELPEMTTVADVAPETSILIPDASFVIQSLDKLVTSRALAERGLPTPHSTILGAPDAPEYPCFAKPRRGRGSRGIQILSNPSEAGAYLELSGFQASDIVAQNLLIGREFTVMMAADRQGRLHAIVPVEVGVKRGITIHAQITLEPEVIAACRAIHDSFTPSGCYNIQLMLTADGGAVPFEINPRVSTTLCLGVASGIDPVEIFDATDAPDELLPVRAGLELHRHWKNVIH